MLAANTMISDPEKYATFQHFIFPLPVGANFLQDPVPFEP
jgi:hypothetical protein